MSVIAKSFISKQTLNVVAKSLKDLVGEFTKQKFFLAKPKKEPHMIHQSKAGNLQIMFVNKDDQTERVFVRISAALDAALAAKEPVKLEESPVYQTDIMDITKNPAIKTGEMLVIGLAGSEIEFVGDADVTKLLAGNFVRPEPATP